MHIFKNTHFDFLRWRWQAIGLSTVILLAGLGTIVTKGLPLGVEFAGGTVIIAQFEDATPIQAVRGVLADRFGQSVIVQTYGEAALNQIMVRVAEVGAESGSELSAMARAAEQSLRDANVGAFEIVGTEIVGPAVGRDLTNKGIWATVLSLGGILLYITFRYQLSFAVGVVVATLHDLLVIMAFLAFFQYDLTLNVIAAILAVAGYSTNDTIVIFDRVRENLRGMRRDALGHVVNVSINQTLGRTVITSGTTILSALALFLFGGEVLRGFSFTLIVGVVTGTYSTVFIAAAIATFWRGRGPAKAGARSPAVGAGAAPQQPARKVKPQRKARAS